MRFNFVIKKNNNGAAIVCSHVAKNKTPICLAIKNEPLDENDSGWQFLCNSGKEESEELAEVWSVNEILELEPTLLKYIDEPIGTTLIRVDKNSEWEISH